ncbi:MAG TPA: phosphotransferase [Dehalococcoidia bacterium]|nr:phosphotransferase [Dehalococcoidia bacterium]
MTSSNLVHELLPDIETLISPQTLSALTGGSIRSVERQPLSHVDGLSGGKLENVLTNGGAGPRLVLKRIAYEWDWVMRVTGDRLCRAIVSWQTGLLDQLPLEISHEVLACARDGSGWAILMHDVGAHLIPPGDGKLTETENARFMEAMAALNAAFWGQPELADPRLGFADLRMRYGVLSPQVLEAEATGGDEIPPMAIAGWQLLESGVDPHVAQAVQRVHENPALLGAAMLAYPQTIVHGDWKLGNLGLYPEPDGPAIVLDWAWVGSGPPAVELAWYLAVNSARLPVSKEQTIEMYREALARRLGGEFDDGWWQPQLELALLGGFALLAWPKLLGAAHGSEEVRRREQAELDWWSERVLQGARRL